MMVRAGAVDAALTVAVVGAGPRSVSYTRDVMGGKAGAIRVVAVVDPNAVRRDTLAEAHGVPPENRFASYEELAARPGVAEAVINTTLDTVHYASTMALLRAGYHVLLEKPIAPTEEEVRGIMDAAREGGRVVMVCHILRYEPFYQTIKRLVDGGRIGRLISVHTTEDMSYDHVATTYLRHPRNLQPNVLPMLLSKCCHDLDVGAWIVGKSLHRVSSAITPGQFRPENAPPGSAKRCLDGCEVEGVCRYSARAIHVEDDTWDAYAWPVNEYPQRPGREEKLRVLKETSFYGRCAWHCPNPVVDRQAVIAEFEGGVTLTHDLSCATSKRSRTIRVVGTEGEVEGLFEAGTIVLRRAVRGQIGRWVEDRWDVSPPDWKLPSPRPCEKALIADFVGTVRGDANAPGVTRIEASLAGHQIAFAAEIAAKEGRVVDICDGRIVETAVV